MKTCIFPNGIKRAHQVTPLFKKDDAMTTSKEEGKDQESKNSSTTPDPGHHIGK